MVLDKGVGEAGPGAGGGAGAPGHGSRGWAVSSGEERKEEGQGEAENSTPSCGWPSGVLCMVTSRSCVSLLGRSSAGLGQHEPC